MSSTLSKVIKKELADGVGVPDWTLTEPGAAEDVYPLPLRQVGSEAASGCAQRAPSAAAAADADLEAMRQRAFSDGYAAGERAATETARKQWETTRAALARILDETVRFKARLRTEAEKELVALVLAVARRIVRRELTVDPQTVLAITRSCLADHTRAEVHRLRVNPKDHELVRTHLGSGNVEIVADPTVSPGGAVLETRQGELDARIETQLEEIEKGLSDA